MQADSSTLLGMKPARRRKPIRPEDLFPTLTEEQLADAAIRLRAYAEILFELACEPGWVDCVLDAARTQQTTSGSPKVDHKT